MKKRFSVPPIPSSEITSESAWLRRRDLMKSGATIAAGTALSTLSGVAGAAPKTGGKPLKFAEATPGESGFFTSEDMTPFGDASSYCNFYEFGTGKGDPVEYAHEMSTDPW